MDWFGNIPISTDFKDVTLPKQNCKRVWVRVKNYRQSLRSALDATPTTANYGRTSTKAMANMMLSKLYLNAEKWAGTAKWDEAINAASAVIQHAWL